MVSFFASPASLSGCGQPLQLRQQRSSWWLLSFLAWMVTIIQQVQYVDAGTSPSEVGKWWKDSQIIMETLKDYQALWIKVHNCV